MQNWKAKQKIAFWIGATLVTAILVYGLTLLDYFANRTFIKTNLAALPLRYAISLAFAQFTWWAFAIAIGAGLLTAFTIWWDTIK